MSQPPRLRDRAALAVLFAGGLSAVLAVMPYRMFDLDRFSAPKELALHLTALVAGLVLMSGARRVSLTRADLALIAWIGLSLVSGLFATNHGLAARAVAVTLSGGAIFWSARRLAAAGLGGAVARAVAVVIVIGSLTAIAQAYGLKMEFAALNRAPGGTFGNRNFMAHLAAIGVPVLLFCIATARRRTTAVFWTLSLTVCACALVLSRTRAAWLALAVSSVPAFLVMLTGPALIEIPGAKRRVAVAVAALAAGVMLALFVPNSLDWKSDNPYLESVVGVVNYREGSGHGRLLQYAHSTRMAVAHPALGVGPGNWPVAYPRYAPVDDPSLTEGTGTTANPWPSSDWVAALSERGIPGFAALVAALVWLIGGALVSRFDKAQSATTRLAAATGAAALGVAVLEGGFDAVLLLPTPTLVVWALAGALLPPRREIRAVVVTSGRRWVAMLVMLVVGLYAARLSLDRVEAMQLSSLGTLAGHAEAVTRDPGSYRVRIRASEAYAGRGQCAEARTQALAARALLPNALAPKRLLEQCR